MKTLISIAVGVIVFCVVFSACTWTTNVDELVFPETNVSYLLHVKPFLQQNCAYSPCHSSPSDPQSGGIVLIEYHNIMAVAGFVAPTNPDASRFVQILEEKSPHLTHFYRGNITENQIKGVRQWIKEGAVNN